METTESKPNEKRFALIALLVFVLFKAVFFLLANLGIDNIIVGGISLIIVSAMFFYWLPPFFIVFAIERRNVKTLGITIERKQYLFYILSAVVILGLPAIIFGVNRSLVMEFIEQIVYIGLAEEFFFRGYLMTRFCDWLGNLRGLFLSSVIFSLSHILSRLAIHGFSNFLNDLLISLGAFFGGLLFGYIYLRAKSIVAPAIVHVFINMYIPKIISLF